VRKPAVESAAPRHTLAIRPSAKTVLMYPGGDLSSTAGIGRLCTVLNIEIETPDGLTSVNAVANLSDS
jgi:hypothetical protein